MAGLAAPVAARNWVACAPCATTCSALRYKARRPCWRPITGEYVRGAAVNESPIHPFRKHFDDLKTGDSLLTHRRTVSEADIVTFGGVSGDYFYMHFDEIAAKDTQFGKRIAHGYFVLSAAAGLFVSPASARCWPTMAWTTCASWRRWRSATRSARA